MHLPAIEPHHLSGRSSHAASARSSLSPGHGATVDVAVLICSRTALSQAGAAVATLFGRVRLVHIISK